jgi:hypothetical protein
MRQKPLGWLAGASQTVSATPLAGGSRLSYGRRAAGHPRKPAPAPPALPGDYREPEQLEFSFVETDE